MSPGVRRTSWRIITRGAGFSEKPRLVAPGSMRLGPERQFTAQTCCALPEHDQTPQDLDHRRGRVPPPRVDPRWQNVDGALARGAKVPPHQEAQRTPLREAKDLPLIGTVAADAEAIPLIARQLTAIRMRT